MSAVPDTPGPDPSRDAPPPGPLQAGRPAPEARWEVPREQRRLSVFDFLDAVAGPVDRKAVMAAARRGQLRLNDEPTVAGAHLAEGDVLTLDVAPESLQRRATTRLPVLHRDDDLLVADKPSGLPYDAGRRGGDAALTRLAAELPPERGVRGVHRLDKETSGLVLAALGDEAETALVASLRDGTAWVEYLSVVRGDPAEDTGRLDLPLGKRNKAGVRLWPDTSTGTPAATTWRVEERLRGFCVLTLRPEGLGRSHQVRAHLAALGHPALGDALYGEDDRLLLSQLKLDYRPKRGRPERPLLSRPALHAIRAQLPPGPDGRPRRVEAPLPKDLAVLLTQLRRLFPLA